MTALKVLLAFLVMFAVIRLLRILVVGRVSNPPKVWVWRIYPWVIDDGYITNLRNGRSFTRSRRQKLPTIESAN